MGYIPFDPHAANLMFMLVSRRYERASLIVTSNKPFSAWGEIFGIVIDDVGLLPVSAEAAEALFRVVDAAYEKRSIALSSNIHPAGFDELMPKTLAAANVDRLLYHANVLITDGSEVGPLQASKPGPVQVATFTGTRWGAVQGYWLGRATASCRFPCVPLSREPINLAFPHGSGFPGDADVRHPEEPRSR